jgi:hypothetical protein
MSNTLRAIGGMVIALVLVGSASSAFCQGSPSSSSESSSRAANVPTYQYDFFLAAASLLFGSIGEDPAVLAGTARHDPWKQTLNGVTIAPLPESRSTAVTTLVWGGYELTDHVGLGPNQRLVVGAFYRRDWAWTDFSGFGEQRNQNNSFGALAAYVIDAWQISAGFGIDFGDGKMTTFPSGAQGKFNTTGQSVAVQVSRVFTLLGDRRPVVRSDQGPWQFQVRQMSVYFIPTFRAGYSRSRVGSFSDNAGATFGREIERFWTIGGSFTISAVIPQNTGPLWRPYIEFSVDRLVDYRHTIDIPATGLRSRLDQDKTYWGVSGGVSVWINRNVSLGVSGFYRGSGDHDGAGGLFWVRVNLFGPGGYLRGGIFKR